MDIQLGCIWWWCLNRFFPVCYLTMLTGIFLWILAKINLRTRGKNSKEEMIKKYHNYTLQTNQGHREEESENAYSRSMIFWHFCIGDQERGEHVTRQSLCSSHTHSTNVDKDLEHTLDLKLKPVSHRTRLGTRFQYGILGYTPVDWYEYLTPTCLGMS